MKNLILATAFFLLVIGDAFSSVVILNGLTHTYSGRPGDYIQGELVLMNTTDREQRITFRLNDVLFSCGTTRVFSENTSHDQSSKTWFEGSLMDKVLLPREKYIYKYSIHIPKNSTLKGSFWSALMIEVEKPVKEERLTANIDLNTKIRYAVGLITNVNQFSEISLDFENIEMVRDTLKNNMLEINLFNASRFVEGVRLSLEVYDAKGEKVLEKNSERPMVFPNMCKEFVLDINDLEKGDYECILIADSRKEFVGTNLSLSIQ
ncbi:hypothetical protein RM553_14045 [Zunongwangia sp. F363]|uniref:DUF3324 domain-containing protein n=1 Tax=Autumnicola tepida TaxID=3075595 RepID=A0ABU3CC89_9FLAO|nr:hypothetical protein [Zunongwangia sp. F363]MDT0643955.1 hypothetical protein [Zunongwangia sp. F363]